MSEETNCSCECGATRFTVRGTPLTRGFCHCTICQSFNGAPFGDFTVFRGRDVDMPARDGVRYHSYRSPPLLQRGKCVRCEKPAIEYVRVLPRLVLVPTANTRDPSLVVEPSLHIFYDTRVADVEDSLPKYSGYLRSQSAFSAAVMRGLLKSGG
jgi:hypothetical protein